MSLPRSCRIILEKGLSRAPVPEFLRFGSPARPLRDSGARLPAILAGKIEGRPSTAFDGGLDFLSRL